MFLKPPDGVAISKLLKAPLTKSAKEAQKDKKSVAVCFTCDGRGIILCVQGIFKAKLTCHTCKGDGVVDI